MSIAQQVKGMPENKEQQVPELKAFTVRVPEELKRQIDVWCSTWGNVPLSTFMEEAVRLYLKDQAQQGRKVPKLPPLE